MRFERGQKNCTCNDVMVMLMLDRGMDLDLDLFGAFDLIS